MNNKRTLLKNTFFLYLLTFSNYFFGFITVPYLSRILGPEVFGELGFAMAFYMYFALVLDFGFLLSGTKAVAENSNSSFRLSKILSGITYAKISIFILLLIIVLIITTIPRLSSCKTLIILYLISALFNGLIPDFVYRGLEDMKMVTIRAVLLRFIATLLTFLLVRDAKGINYVPICQIIGGISALTLVLIHLKKHYNITLGKSSFQYSISLIKKSVPFFLSRIASSIYGVTNTIVLGFVSPTGPVLGYYNSTEKIKSLATQAYSPISDSFYPYMLRTKDYKRLFKVTMLLEAAIIVGCIIVWIFAEQLCIIIFGAEYAEAADILRYQLPLIAIIFLSYMLGFPALSPINQDKWANIAIIFAMLNQIIGMITLLLIGKFDVFSMCILTCISESVCMLTRAITLWVSIKNIHNDACSKYIST